MLKTPAAKCLSGKKATTRAQKEDEPLSVRSVLFNLLQPYVHLDNGLSFFGAECRANASIRKLIATRTFHYYD